MHASANSHECKYRGRDSRLAFDGRHRPRSHDQINSGATRTETVDAEKVQIGCRSALMNGSEPQTNTIGLYQSEDQRLVQLRFSGELHGKRFRRRHAARSFPPSSFIWAPSHTMSVRGQGPRLPLARLRRPLLKMPMSDEFRPMIYTTESEVRLLTTRSNRRVTFARAGLDRLRSWGTRACSDAAQRQRLGRNVHPLGCRSRSRQNLR